MIQPYTRFSYISTEDLDPLFPAVDRETFSTCPQPLGVPSFTAIDSLRDWSIVRFGVRNKLITKRDGQSFDWLSMDTYFDAFITDPDYNRNFSNSQRPALESPALVRHELGNAVPGDR